MSGKVEFAQTGVIATITLANPSKRNAMTRAKIKGAHIRKA